MNATTYGMLLPMLDRVRTKNLHIVGGRGRVLIYFRMNDNHNRNGGLHETIFVLARAQFMGQIVVTWWNRLVSPLHSS